MTTKDDSSMPIALTKAQLAMLDSFEQLSDHWWSTEVKDEVKALDDLVTLKLARRKGNLFIISQYGIAELTLIRGE
jgi:hypothetical protein